MVISTLRSLSNVYLELNSVVAIYVITLTRKRKAKKIWTDKSYLPRKGEKGVSRENKLTKK